jgi:SAM-dependent methyltransferase
MYDSFSEDYDRFVNWQGRLSAELPFITAQLQRLAAPGDVRARVLDAACGTGMHAIALAQRGFRVAGADLSAAMVERARQNAGVAGAAVHFEAAGFGALSAAFGGEAFDAVVCLGNSLPHVLTPEDLLAALRDFAACLRPEGLLLIQNRNFDAVLASGERWMEPQSHREGDVERIFLRFYDFEPAGVIAFNILSLKRSGQGPWSQQVMTTRLRPITQTDLLATLSKAGFARTESFGSMSGEPFDPAASGNLVTLSWKAQP